MRIRTVAAALAAVAVSAGAAAPVLANVHGSSDARAASAATIKLGRTNAGQLVETASGLTLYTFSRDGRERDTCLGVSGCASVWPPYTVTGNLTAGSGVKRALLGSINIGHARHQVTYAGHPLYLYAGDSTQGDTGYLGFTSFGGTWLGIGASGQSVR